MNFDILRPDVVDQLSDYEWFRTAITLAYRDVAKTYGCVPIMSGEKLLQTYDIFWDDVENGRKRHLAEGTVTLNQHKVSAYLTFWLRRMNPLIETRIVQTLSDRQSWEQGTDRFEKKVEDFLLCGNEIAAFNIGMKISQYLTVIEKPAGNVAPIREMDSLDIAQIDDETILEFAKILKYKNISAHSLIMVFQMMSRSGLKFSR